MVLGLDSAQFENGIRRANRSNQQLVSNTKVAANAVRGLAAALGVVSVAAAARGYLSLADQSAKLTAQLKLATAQTGSFAKAQADVSRIAATTRTGLAETADLYATFQRNAVELGITQEQAARSTETITKAFRISGATAAEAAGGLRQLLQGIQSGTLRGEELNSVLENAPRLARALADGLGVTIGQLRAMGKEGELTGEKVVSALESAARQIDMEFKELPVTFGESMVLVSNAAIATFGEFDRGGGFSKMLANFITDGSDGFEKLSKDARELGIDIRSSLAGLGDAFQPLLDGARKVFAQLGIEAQSLNEMIRTELRDIDKFTATVGRQGLLGRLATGGTVSEWWNNEPTRGTTLLRDYDAGKAASERRRRGELAAEDFQILNRDARVDILGNPLEAPTRPAGSESPDKAAESARKKAEREAETARKKAERETERAIVALRRFVDTVGREEADLAAALAELSGNTSELADARVQQIEADRAARQRDIEADDSLDAAQRQRLIILNDENASAQRQLVRKEEVEAELEKQERIAVAGLDLEMELLSLTGALARSAAGQRDVELRILDMAFERERLELEGIKARNAITSAEWQIADARLKQLGALHVGARQQVMVRTQGPLESFLDRLPKTADEAREALERVQVDGINGIVDGLADAASATQSLGDVFKRVTQQIIADLMRIQIQKAIVGALRSAIGGGTSLGASTAGTFAQNSGFINNLVSQPVKLSSLDLEGFATGGSFKVGGMPGIDKNVVAFKATRGEMVDIRRPGNDNGGSGARFQFDLRGAVMTADLLSQMNQMAQGAAVGGAMGGASLAQDNIARRSRNRIP